MRVVLVLALGLSGCALAPQALRLEADHVSHLTQHAPLTDHPTNYGYDSVNVVAHWTHSHWYLDVSEGAVLEACDADYCGALAGPREVFTARAGYEFPLR